MLYFMWELLKSLTKILAYCTTAHQIKCADLSFKACVRVTDELLFLLIYPQLSYTNNSTRLTPAGVRGLQGGRAIREKYGL